MGLKAQSTGEPRELIPCLTSDGKTITYLAVVVGVYDLGTQSGGQYGPNHQILVTFELHRKRGPAKDKAGRVFLISNFYNLSFGEGSNLRKDVEKILGRKFTDAEAKDGFDVETLLGKACRLQIEHKTKDGKTRAIIGGLMSLDEDDPTPETESDEVYYEIDSSRTVPDSIPDWIGKLIRRSKEFGGSGGSGGSSKGNGAGQPVGTAVSDDDDDIPF